MLLLLAPLAHAATITVGSSGAADHATLAEGLAAAADGDTLLLEAGRFEECVDLGALDLTIEGTGADETVLAAADACTEPLVQHSGSSLILRTLAMTAPGLTCVQTGADTVELDQVELFDCGALPTLDGGETLSGGGLALLGDAQLTVRDSLLRDNQADLGAAIYAAGALDLVMEDSSLLRNTATISGGGLYVVAESSLEISGSSWSEDLALTGTGGDVAVDRVSDVQITDSSSWGAWSPGGSAALDLGDVDGTVLFDGVEVVAAGCEDCSGAALRVSGTGDVEITGSSFLDNSARRDGGAVYLSTTGAVRLSDSVFRGNFADRYGGGLAVSDAASVELSGLSIEDNRGEYSAGGVLVQDVPEVTVTDCDFVGNRVTGDKKSGDDSPQPYGGGLHVFASDVVAEVSGSFFCDNEAGVGAGLTFSHWGNGDIVVDLSESVFFRNTGGEGSGVGEGGWIWADEITVVDVTVVGHSGGGQALRLSGSSIDVGNTLVAHNPSGYGLSTSGSTTASYLAVYDNPDGDFDGSIDETVAATGLVTDDPMLVHVDLDAPCEEQDLRPSADSPLVDAGDPDRADADGSRSDIGALDAASGDGDTGDVPELPSTPAGLVRPEAIGAGCSSAPAQGWLAVLGLVLGWGRSSRRRRA